MSTSVTVAACSDLPGMKNDSFSFLLLLLQPCEGCPKQVVDRNIYHHVTKIQQPDWPLATCATPNMPTLAAEEVACAGSGAGATGSSSRSASTELILHLHVARLGNSDHPQHPASLPRAEPAEVCARAGARAQNPQGRRGPSSSQCSRYV